MADFPAAHDLVHEVLVIASQVLAPWYVVRLMVGWQRFLVLRGAVGEFKGRVIACGERDFDLTPG